MKYKNEFFYGVTYVYVDGYDEATELDTDTECGKVIDTVTACSIMTVILAAAATVLCFIRVTNDNVMTKKCGIAATVGGIIVSMTAFCAYYDKCFQPAAEDRELELGASLVLELVACILLIISTIMQLLFNGDANEGHIAANVELKDVDRFAAYSTQ